MDAPGDIDRRLGGLVILEGSHRLDDLQQATAGRTWTPSARTATTGSGSIRKGIAIRPSDATGAITEDTWGCAGDWGALADHGLRAGDLLLFGMYLVHASLDNTSPDRIRLSTDTRYQRASDPVDERWVGGGAARARAPVRARRYLLAEGTLTPMVRARPSGRARSAPASTPHHQV